MRRGLLFAVAAVAIAAAFSVSLAGHIAAISAVMQFYPAANPVYFVAGSNAGSTDVVGKTISVTISPNGTQAQVSVDLVYGENQYIDLLEINVTNAPQTLYIAADPSSSIFNTTYIDLTNSKIIIYNTTGYPIATLTFSQLATGQPLPSGGISADAIGTYRIDMIVVMKDGLPLPSTPFTLTLKVYYTKSSETPITS